MRERKQTTETELLDKTVKQLQLQPRAAQIRIVEYLYERYRLIPEKDEPEPGKLSAVS